MFSRQHSGIYIIPYMIVMLTCSKWPIVEPYVRVFPFNLMGCSTFRFVNVTLILGKIDVAQDMEQ
jgi:hypothetical protein